MDSGPRSSRTSPVKLEPRDERVRLPQRESPTKTGLRKRGQTSRHTPQTSDSSTLLNVENSLRPHYARSIASIRSEMTLGILDYYLHDEEIEPEPVIDPAMQSFNFDLSPAKPDQTPTRDDDRSMLPSNRTNFLRKAFTPKHSTTPPKKRLGLSALQQSRRRSSLSICCQGEGMIEQHPPNIQESDVVPVPPSRTTDSSPISPRNITSGSVSSDGASWQRRDSVASLGSHNIPRHAQSSAYSRKDDELPPTPKSSRASTRNSADHETVSQHSTTGSSFTFVRSIRRRPVPLSEAPKDHDKAFKQRSKRFVLVLRRLLSLRRR